MIYRLGNGQSNDARLPHRLPRRSLQSHPQRRRSAKRKVHHPSTHLPPAPFLDQSRPPLQTHRLVGHADLHLPARAPLPDPRSPHRPAPHDPTAGPRHSRRHHPVLHPGLGSDEAGLPGRAGEGVFRHAGSQRRQDVPGHGCATHRTRRRLQRPHRQVRISGPRALRHQRHAPPRQEIRHDLRRQRHHPYLPGFQSRHAGSR